MDFDQHLEQSSRIVEKWPKWQQEILGGTRFSNPCAGLDDQMKYEIEKKGMKFRSGKVRDIVEYDSFIMMITTDRISAFDVVMSSMVNGRGRILNQISKFWKHFFDDVPNDMISLKNLNTNIFGEYTGISPKNISIHRKLNIIPIEFIVRGYMTGSLWKEYSSMSSGVVHKGDYLLPANLKLASALPDPIFTPYTKAEQGQHDEAISFEYAINICKHFMNIDYSTAEQIMITLSRLSVDLYKRAYRYAFMRGFIIADTKFEFGTDGSQFYLCDEVLTPDSSRYWSIKDYAAGKEPDSFDKQILRNYLQKLIDNGEWDKTSPGPSLPEWLTDRILHKYQDVRNRLVPIGGCSEKSC